MGKLSIDDLSQPNLNLEEQVNTHKMKNDKNYKFKQLVLVEFNNASPFLYQIVSDSEITMEKVANYFIDTEGFNEERDCLTFLNNDIDILKI